MIEGSPIYLGVDGGGTKTIARLVQFTPAGGACVLASGESAGSNPYSVGWDAAQRNIEAAIAAAAGGGAAAVTARHGVLAIAGCSAESPRSRLSAWADGAGFAGRIDVVPDTAPVVADAPPQTPAVGLIAGTGSSAIAVSAQCEATLVGGWGYLIDDAGSGYAIGRDALRAVVRLAEEAAAVGRQAERESLAAGVLEALGVESVEEVRTAVYGADDPRRMIAAAAQPVLLAAKRGDRVAAEIAERGADELARLVAIAAERLGASDPITVYCSGSLLQRSAYYRSLVASRCRGVEAVRLAPDAACGCARLAARASSARA